MIKTRDSVHEDFSDCSSGNGPNSYYETKGDAIRAFESTLAEYGLCFDPDDMICMLGDNGCFMIDIYTDELECAKCVGRAMLMWYKMDQTGRWEFTGYIA